MTTLGDKRGILPQSRRLTFMWLQITGRCQLECTHCYADSGPAGSHGTMTLPEWLRVIDEAAGLGVRAVQIIGGEPTLHSGLVQLLDHALSRKLAVEVFSNLVHVAPELWEAFDRPGVRLATSWYSDDASEHAAITRRPSHRRTLDGIKEAMRRGIPLRVAIIGVRDGQRIAQAEAVLRNLGVTDIGYDDLRQVGRGARLEVPDPAQLCGACLGGNIAVAADGTVWPCVFARWLPVGNTREMALREILAGPAMASVTEYLNEHFTPIEAPCVPRMCDPQCGPSCSPACRPRGDCRPAGGCTPRYQ